MFNILRPYLARVFASVAAGVALWAGEHFGVNLLPEHVEAISAFLMTLALIVYGVVHKAINSRVNPTDAAKVDMAAKGVR